MYDLVCILLDILSTAFQGYCLQYFYGNFLESRMGKKLHGGIFSAVFYTVLKLGINLVLPSDYGSARVFTKLALTICILSMDAVCFYRTANKITIFLVMVFLAVSEISFFLAHMVFQLGNCLYPLWMGCMQRGYIRSADIFDRILTGTTFGLPILMHFLAAVILYAVLKNIVGNFREKEYAIHWMELLFLLTPGMTGFFICVLLRMILATMENGMPALMYDKYPLLMVIVPVILVLALLSVLFGVKLFQNMICWNREKSSRIILEKQVSNLQEHMGEMERVYAGIRGMRHDMKNTISVIWQLAEDGGKEKELKGYLQEMNQTMDRLEFRFQTGNAVADTLLNMKYHEILTKVPDLQMDVEGLQFPKRLFIQSYDIGIILGNALDNAMEACERLRAREPEADTFIRMDSFWKRELLFLKVENSFDGRLKQRFREELPLTEKADRENHGMGLLNIKNTAEKYQGTMDFKVKGRIFILSVMLKNEKLEQE